jgi:hypothetical protein
MKRRIHLFFYLLSAGLFLTSGTNAQTGLAPDQNPNYMVSRDKYIQLSDSLTAYQSTTIQDTYKAIDWMQFRRDARAERRAFRRELRLERARYGGYYYDNYYPVYDYNYYNYPNYRRYGNYGYYGRGWGNNFYRNAVPLALTAGALAWWLSR